MVLDVRERREISGFGHWFIGLSFPSIEIDNYKIIPQEERYSGALLPHEGSRYPSPPLCSHYIILIDGFIHCKFP